MVLDPSGKALERVQYVKSNVGEKTNKVILKFKDSETRDKFIHKYHEDYLITDDETHKIAILPFQLRTSEKKKRFR